MLNKHKQIPVYYSLTLLRRVTRYCVLVNMNLLNTEDISRYFKKFLEILQICFFITDKVKSTDTSN